MNNGYRKGLEISEKEICKLIFIINSFEESSVMILFGSFGLFYIDTKGRERDGGMRAWVI